MSTAPGLLLIVDGLRDAVTDWQARRIALRLSLNRLAALYDEPADFALEAMRQSTAVVERMAKREKG